MKGATVLPPSPAQAMAMPGDMRCSFHDERSAWPCEERARPHSLPPTHPQSQPTRNTKPSLPLIPQNFPRKFPPKKLSYSQSPQPISAFEALDAVNQGFEAKKQTCAALWGADKRKEQSAHLAAALSTAAAPLAAGLQRGDLWRREIK